MKAPRWHRLLALSLPAALVATCGGEAEESSPEDECVSAAPCGDPDVGARYESCSAAEDQATCEAEGGTWQQLHMSPEWGCYCPTGQAGCPCRRSSDCLSACVGDFVGTMSCEGVVQGECAAVSYLDPCGCIFDDQCQPQGICV